MAFSTKKDLSMTEKQDKQYIHWQDLAEQLGADTSQEINDYFGGTVDFRAVELDASDLPDSLPPQPEATFMNSNSADRSPRDNSDQADEVTASAHETAAVKIDSAMDIGWTVPDPTAQPQPAAEKNPAKKQRTPSKSEKKKVPAAPAATKTQPDEKHWDSLASSLGLQADTGSQPPTPAKPASAKPVAERLPATSQKREPEGGKTIAPPEKAENRSKRKRPQKPRAAAASAAPSGPAEPPISGFGAGIIDFGEVPTTHGKTEHSAEDDPRLVDLPDHDPIDDHAFADDSRADDSRDDDWQADDSESELEEVQEVSAFDSEYVEFEVEDLDPSGGRPRSRRKSPRDRDRSAPRKLESPEQTVISDADPEAPIPEKVETAEAGTERRPRRRRRKRAEESSPDQASNEDQSRPRRGRQDSVATADDSPDVDLLSDDEPPSGRVKRGRTGSETAKKLPTWNDTIDVIVEANISARGKKPARRKRSSPRTRRAGPGREQK